MYSNCSHSRRKILLAFRTWHDKQGKHTGNTRHIQHTRQPPLGGNVTPSPSPARVKLLALLGGCDNPRCCRLIGSLVNSWRAVTCSVVVSEFTPTYPLLRESLKINVKKVVDIYLEREISTPIRLLHLRMRLSGFL